MTTQKDFLGRLIKLLDEAGIPYMVAGSQLETLIALLGQGYYVSREVAFDALRRRTLFNVIDLEGGGKADLIIRKERPFSRQEFERRRQISAMGQMLWVVAPEDTILSKLEWMKGRESDIQYADAVGVAVTQWNNLDLEYLRKWAAQLGVEEMLVRLLEEAAAQVQGTEQQGRE